MLLQYFLIVDVIRKQNEVENERDIFKMNKMAIHLYRR